MPLSPDTRRRLLGAVPAAALALILLGGVPAAAGPTERLRDFFAAVNAILADPEIGDEPLERVRRIRRLVGEVSDVQAAAALALDREWPARTAGEQGEFVTLFAELLERAYVGRLAGRGRVADGIRIAYLGESVAGDAASVRTALRARDGDEAVVEYRMVNRQGRWRIFDLVLDGVSTVENYRAQFRRILRQGTYQDLVAQVRAKLGDESVLFARVEAPNAPAPRTEPVQAARLGEGATDRDRQPAAVRAGATGAEAAGAPPVTTVRSRDVGWRIGGTVNATAPTGRAGTAPGRSAAYWVQVGAFRTAAAAERLAERLSGGAVVASANGRLLLVRVGPFAQRAPAVAKLRELQALGYQPFIATGEN